MTTDEQDLDRAEGEGMIDRRSTIRAQRDEHAMTTINERLDQMAEDCRYAAEPDDVDYEVDDSVDALIAYKDGLEDLASTEGAALDELHALLYLDEDGEPRAQFPSGANVCEVLARVLAKTGRTEPQVTR